MFLIILFFFILNDVYQLFFLLNNMFLHFNFFDVVEWITFYFELSLLFRVRR